MAMSLAAHPLLREVVDVAPVMIWMAGRDKLCNYFNRTWLEFTGRGIEAELGDGWAEGVHPDDFAHCLKVYVQSFDARMPFTMEYRLRRHDGAYRWILDNGKPLHTADGEFVGYAGSCVDITDKKEAEIALEQREERYRLAMDVMSEGIWDFDLQANKNYISKSYFSNLGYEPSELGPNTREKIIELMHPDDRDSALAFIERSINAEGKFAVEYRLRAKSGEYRWIQSHGQVVRRDEDSRPLRIVGAHTDIDARKKAEIALQESMLFVKSQNAELEWIYTNAPIGLCMLDANLRYLRINQRLADFVGRSIAEHLGQSIDDIVPDLAPTIRAVAQSVMATREPALHIEVDGVIPDREDLTRTFLFSCFPVSDGDRHISGFGFVVEEITERKKLELRLSHLNSELEAKIWDRTKELAEVNDALLRLSRTDVLTGLKNRFAANERLAEEFSRLKRTADPYTILMADIDYFKNVNDAHGHPVGDDVLGFIADIFLDNLRKHDFIARYGGEEFLILLPSTPLDQALVVAEKIRATVQATPHPVAGVITVSIGAAEAALDQPDADAAVREADRRLYKAKKYGRNRVAPSALVPEI